MATDSNLRKQIWICEKRLQSVAADSNLWERFELCGHYVTTNLNLFPQIRICGHRLQCKYDRKYILFKLQNVFKQDCKQPDRKSERVSWRIEDLDAAIARGRDDDLSLRQASQYYHVPKSTIVRYSLQPGRLGCSYVLDDEHEQELFQYLIVMQKFYQVITSADLKKLVYQLAERNGI